MRITETVSDTKLKEYLLDFYKYFTNGYEFETFLKPFLENLGLTEVVVTKKSGDDGIDLFAVRKGIDEIAGNDYVKYKIQAKKYLPSKSVPPEKIDALRGNLQYNEKGLFITTGKVSDNAKEQAIRKDPYKPVYVIDGIDLIRVCIERQIGFSYSPQFSKEALDEFNKKEETVTVLTNNTDLQAVEKTITKNDIRCTILSMPRFIIDKMKEISIKRKLQVVVNKNDKYNMSFVPNRNYLYCGNDFVTKYKLKNKDGSIIERNARWSINEDEIIYIDIN